MKTNDLIQVLQTMEATKEIERQAEQKRGLQITKKNLQTAKTGAIATYIIGGIYAPEMTAQATCAALSAGNYILPVGIGVYCTVKRRKAIWKFIRKLGLTKGTYHGVNRQELMDYLLQIEDEDRAFSRDPFIEKFYVENTEHTRQKFKRIATALERAGILEQGGKSNARKVKPLTQEEIKTALRSAQEGADITRNYIERPKTREDVKKSITGQLWKKMTQKKKPFTVRRIGTLGTA